MLAKNAHIYPKEQQQDYNRWRLKDPPPTAGKHVKHVREEGSRFHVIYYDTKGSHCSEPNCEINYPKEKE